MTVAQPVPRRTRADFERNRSIILDQAERHFTEHGVGASLEAVARDAGVGSATLHRHFPSRDALLAELLERRSSQFAAERQRIGQLADSAQALEEWITALIEFFAAFDGLSGPLRSAYLEEHNPLAVTCEGFIELTNSVVLAAQREGTVHPWLRGRDVFLLALSISWVRAASLADESSYDQLRLLWARGYRRAD